MYLSDNLLFDKLLETSSRVQQSAGGDNGKSATSNWSARNINIGHNKTFELKHIAQYKLYCIACQRLWCLSELSMKDRRPDSGKLYSWGRLYSSLSYGILLTTYSCADFYHWEVLLG